MALSSCAGCSNEDYVTNLRLKRAHSPSEALARADQAVREVHNATRRLDQLEAAVGGLRVSTDEQSCDVTCMGEGAHLRLSRGREESDRRMLLDGSDATDEDKHTHSRGAGADAVQQVLEETISELARAKIELRLLRQENARLRQEAARRAA